MTDRINNFGNFELQEELQNEAAAIARRGNTDLVFGGSSEQEAEVFGRDISASDAPRVGAFLGGVALANLKTQQERALRFNRLQEIQKDIQRERESQRAERLSKENNQRDNSTSRANNQNTNSTGLQKAKIADATDRVGIGAGLTKAKIADKTNRFSISQQDERAANRIAADKEIAGTRAGQKAAEEQERLDVERVIQTELSKPRPLIDVDNIPNTNAGRKVVAENIIAAQKQEALKGLSDEELRNLANGGGGQ